MATLSPPYVGKLTGDSVETDRGEDEEAPQGPVPVVNADPVHVMQAKPGVFTNERGNLKFVACAARCPCIALAIVYLIAIVLTMILM